MLDVLDKYLSGLWESISATSWWRYLSETNLWQNSLLTWLWALAAAVVVLLAARVVKRVLLVRLRAFTLKSPTRLDDILVQTLEATRWYFYLAIATFVASQALKMNRRVEAAFDGSVFIVLLLQVGVWLQTLATKLVFRWAERQGARSSTTFAAGVNFAFRVVIWVVVLLLALSNLGIEINALVAGLGVGGVAAALAVQSLLSDVFASVSIYFDRPFDIGDFIIVDDFYGTIQEIGTRTTRIASLSGEQIIFSNSDLVRSRIRNFARMSERRNAFSFGIEYDSTADKVERAAEIAREVIEGTNEVRFDRAHFASFGAYSLDFEVVYFVLSPDYAVHMQRQHEIKLGIYRRFEAAGIRFAFPTRTLHVHHAPSANGTSDALADSARANDGKTPQEPQRPASESPSHKGN